MEAAESSETLVSYHITWRHNAGNFDLNLDPEDGGSIVLRNVGILSHCTESTQKTSM